VKLLFVVPCYLPATRFGGPIKSIHELARSLVRDGHELTVFTTNSNGPGDLDVALGSPVKIDGVNVVYYKVTWPRRYFHSPALANALRSTVRDFDLVYTAWMYVHPSTTAAREAWKHGVPCIVSPRGMLDRNAIKQKGRLKKAAYLAMLGRKMLERAASIHFTSDGERHNCAVPLPESKCVVVPNGIDVDAELTLSSQPSARFRHLGQGRLVLFLGRLSYIKGLDLLSDAWPMVVKEVPDARLILAGADDEKLWERLQRKFGQSGVSNAVTYVGLVGGEAKGELLERCSILVNPSYLESFGMSIVEAMAHAKPVVVTDRVNIASDITKAGAGLVTPCDPLEIARALIWLLRDPHQCVSRGHSGREFVRQNYSVESVASRMAAVFADSISQEAALQ
jgi:glycosyltransferase involved in cell wall biosynthesis